MFSNIGQHTHVLYTNLPPNIEDYINNTHLNFNATIEDAFIWSQNKNGAYSKKSEYSWLLSLSYSQTNDGIQIAWSWIWKLKAPEKYKFLVWLACHDAVPTMTLLHHRKISPTATCTRCGDHEESLLHCIRDCRHSKIIWHIVGFLSHDFFYTTCPTEWIRNGTNSPHSTLFLATLWWVWRNRNLMCLNNETRSLYYLVSNIYNSIDTIISAFKDGDAAIFNERHVK